MPHLSAAPGVDALVVVADDAQVSADAGEKLQQPKLRIVGVLVFVDEQIAVALLVAGEDVRLLVEDLQRQEQQIIEVDRAQRAQPELVFRQELRGAQLVFVVGMAFGAAAALARKYT